MQHRTPLVAAAALLALASLARAQDPPADLLEHVKVGQRWTFATTAGTFRSEEVWHVAEVKADERSVSYLVTVRTFNEGKLITETVGQELTAWSGAAKATLDPSALAGTKAAQTRQAFECPGMKLEALALTTGGAEAWTAVKGDFETFPGQLRFGSSEAKDSPVRALTKVEEGPPPVAPTAPPVEELVGESNLPAGALDHVKVGQRWLFKATAGGVTQNLAWKVTAVDAARGTVRYDLTVDLKVGAQVMSRTSPDQEWSAGASPVLEPGTTVTGVSGERSPLEVPGAKLDCYVIRTDVGDMHLAVWTAVKGSREVFPGVVKQVVEGSGLELVRVEGP